MSVGFGFSVGDFFAAISLVGTVIDALREAGDASKQFHGLVLELTTLQVTLDEVNRLELRDTQIVERCALLQAVSNCQLVIHEFWITVQKYQPHLQSVGPSLTLRDAWMKIRWAVCKKEDVVKFRADLRSHTGNIELLLTTVQMSTYSLHSHKRDVQQRALTSSIEDASAQSMKKLGDISNAVNYNIRKSSDILQSTHNILHAIRERDEGFSNPSTRVGRQQPVFILDALNREGTFDLDFIRSTESFLAVLKDNFRDIKYGPKKIERGEFLVTLRGTNREIDLSQDWNSCFLPGQRVGMSMLFYQPSYRGGACPSCQFSCTTLPNVEIDCYICGLSFLMLEVSSHLVRESSTLQRLISRHESELGSPNDEISYYRRVRVLGALTDQADNPQSTPNGSTGSSSKNLVQAAAVHTGPTSRERAKGCIQVVERYAVCGCIYHRHEIEHAPRCTCRGRGQTVVMKEVSVGYACEEHTSPSTLQGQAFSTMAPPSLENSLSRPSFDGGMQKKWMGDLPTPPISAPQSWKHDQISNSPRPRSLRKQTGSITSRMDFPISPPISGEENATIWEVAEPSSSPISIRFKGTQGELSSSLPISIKGIPADRNAPPLLALPKHTIDETNDIGWQWANQNFED